MKLYFEPKGIEKQLRAMRQAIELLALNQGSLVTKEMFMATIQDVVADLETIKTQTGDYIAARDAIDATLNAQITTLTAQLAAGTATAAEVQVGIDAAFAAAETDKGLLAPPAVVPPADPAPAAA
jgi:hypothetical protein